jgi:predicted amidophosphoribosyltransferase
VKDAWYDLAFGGCCAGCAAPGRRLCRACRDSLPSTGYPVRPDPAPAGLAPTYAAAPYAHTIRNLLLAHKEHRAFAVTRPLAGVLAAVVRSALLGTGHDIVLVPVPSSPATVRARGHDPMLRMTRSAARMLAADGLRTTALPLLRQYRRVVDQAGLGAVERAANLAGSMAVSAAVHRRLVGRQVLVVICDDVLTTGSTALEAQRALAAVGLPTHLIATLAATERLVPIATALSR